ncbi:MAG: tetratricopeptide repeat protein [Spirochaetaceae bacterium]|nr:tetratricopeptide repeat protein [Spirochaetaceae bacterium]
MVKGSTKRPVGPKAALLCLGLFCIGSLAAAEEPDSGSAVAGILISLSERLEAQDYTGALALFEELPPAQRESALFQGLYASILNLAGHTREARLIIQKVLTVEPNNTEALWALAAIEAAAGKERERRGVLEKILKIDPVHVPALLSLGTIYLESRSWRTAASYFDRVLEVEAENGEALVGRAQVFRYTKEPGKAEALLNRAIAQFPEWSKPRIERARLYRNAHYLTRALADLDVAKRMEADDYWVAIDRGGVLMDLDRKAEAVQEYERAIALDGENFLAYVYSAGLKDDLKDYEGAEQAYRAVIRLKPDYYFAFEGLGILAMRKGQWAAARDAFLEAYKRAPKEPVYALLGGMSWMRAGKATDPELKQFLQKALRGTPRDSLDWAMLRLYHDLTGDGDLINRLDKEKDPDTQARMYYYLANYYDIRGIKTLADTYFIQVKKLNQMRNLEWRLNEWAFEQRNLTISEGS